MMGLSVVRVIKLCKFEKILVSDMGMRKETILTQGYELPLGAFQFF
jgi:hypothetical protein